MVPEQVHSEDLSQRLCVEPVGWTTPFELLEEDIRASPEAFAAWRYDIPVVTIDGHLAFKLRLEEEEVEEYLRRVIGGTSVAPSRGHRE